MGIFLKMSTLCPILCIGDFLHMRVIPEVVVWSYCQKKLIVTILIPNHRANFGDDRLRIADAIVVTDGHDKIEKYTENEEK